MRDGGAGRLLAERARELGGAAALGALASDARSGAAFGAVLGFGVSGVRSLRRLRRGELRPARALADAAYEGASEALSGAISGMAAATAALAVSQSTVALGLTGAKASLATFGLPLASAVVTAVVVRRLLDAHLRRGLEERFSAPGFA